MDVGMGWDGRRVSSDDDHLLALSTRCPPLPSLTLSTSSETSDASLRHCTFRDQTGAKARGVARGRGE